jgi:hypothetical protein
MSLIISRIWLGSGAENDRDYQPPVQFEAKIDFSNLTKKQSKNRFHIKAQRLFFPDRLGRQSSAIHRVKRLKLNQLPQDGVRREMASRLLEMKVGVLISD